MTHESEIDVGLLSDVKNRVTLYRRYKRLLNALDALLEYRIIPEPAYRNSRNKLDVIYKDAKTVLKSRRAKLQRGRPRVVDPRAQVTQCRKIGCELPPAEGQIYCSREHSPYGYYGVSRCSDD